MKKGVLLGIALGVMVACPALGSAAEMGQAGSPKITLSLTKDYTPSPWTTEVGYGQRVASKLGFGVKNLLLGWTALFTEPREASAAGESVAVGIGKGIKNAIEQELGGVVHIATFLVTGIDAPLPNGGTHVI